MQNEIYLWGSGGGACEIKHLIDDLKTAASGYVIKAVVGRGPRTESEDLESLAYIDTAQAGWESAINPQASAIVTAGTSKLREIMWSEIDKLGLDRPILIHPSAAVAVTARLSAGCVVGPNVTISASVKCEKNVYVSFNASVGHHSSIGAHGVISPGARLGGEVTCGPRFFIGLGGIVVPRVKIGGDVSVSAGALVTGSLPDGSRVIARRSRVLGKL
jgi:UDP-3-O-[3-hydroxymyristoyl] glucosamine N-acyltransferase